MAGISMRRLGTLVAAAAFALVASGCVQFTGEKVITGEGEPTGDFVVRISCEIGDETVVEDLTFEGEETQSSGQFELIDSQGEASCFITEIEQAGATNVTYECGEVIFTQAVGFESAGGPGMSVSRGIRPGDVDCTETPDGLEIEILLSEPADVEMEFTVINEFEAPTTAPPAPETVPPAPAVGAQPTFTG